uniref:PLATZ transcription factor family protein n=1 Tax=Aegilops tauschii TaxID=37682 RepID=R7WDG1_AEGTA
MRFRHEAAVAAEGRTPAWLGPLLGAEFFKLCATHPYLVKNECNHYCLDCTGEDDAICCTQCVSAHRNHHIVQIRKSSYREVIRVAELKAVADVSQLDGMVSDPSLTFIVDPRRNQEEPGLETEEEDEGGYGLPGSSNRPPGWISYRRRPRKGIPERAPFY